MAMCDVHVSQAEFLPVYGSPPFTQGVGGYKSNAAAENPILIASDSPVVVNDEGIAVGNTSRVDASGHTLDFRAVRWNATEATELGHLGTDSQGIAFSGVLDINTPARPLAVRVSALSTLSVPGQSVGVLPAPRPQSWSVLASTQVPGASNQ